MSLSNLLRPTFVSYDPETITQDNVELYENLVGKHLYPAQPERLFIDVISYIECLQRQAIQEAAEQNLVAYARDEALDQLGHNVGVARLAAQPATCLVQFTLREALDYAYQLPAGLRFQTSDQLFTFETTEPCYFPAGSTQASCAAAALTPGEDANGYLPGSLQIASLPELVIQATNLTTTSLGAEDEDDETYRQRIPLALEAFSCAGPKLAYRYWAMSAHQSIVDVAVVSPQAGVVQIYPLTSSGAPPEALLELIQEAVNDERRRPLTDMVQVLAPQRLEFNIQAQVTIYGSSDRDAILAQIARHLNEYKTTLSQKMGRDVVPSQISALLQVEGVYEVELLSPREVLEVDEHSYAYLTGWEINIGGVIYE